MVSLWLDNTDKDYESIVENILNYKEWHKPVIDSFDGAELAFAIIDRNLSKKEVEYGNTIIKFTVLDYEYEFLRHGETDNPLRRTRVSEKKGSLIVFSDGKVTKFIIDKGYNKSTLTILRKLNNSQQNNVISEEKFNIKPDLFFWVINKVINSASETLGDVDNMKVQLITGFRGATDDKLAQIEGSGDKVMNSLSTLTFLLETDDLDRMQIRLNHKNSTFTITFHINGNIDINLKEYTGEWTWEPLSLQEPLVIMDVFLEVIPDFLDVYFEEVDESIWNDQYKRAFLNDIGQSLINTLKTKLGLSKVKK